MNIKLDHNDVALTKATTKDSRPVLNTVCVKDGKLAAADGFMLAMRDYEGEKSGEQFLLPAKIINSLKVNTKRHADIDVEKNTIAVNFVDKNGETLADEYPVIFQTHDIGNFPNVNALFQNTEKKGEIALNVGLLKKLLSCLPEKGCLRLRVSEVDKPVEYSCEAEDRPIHGLLMPMYVDWESFKWYSETINKSEES